ncbi:dTDP-glucose 4,6-dehydratase [Halobacteriovorax marinus SJ]|uniref:dTDP-glucose 4,6-dehydratase n=1 Tax=Halobacteriovorax marinus (strain ATCC BAA-682 / DSM 15412 / SJ) TaxID=862908 RepID=E1X3F9_HALMS|nr:dTDP-glucose 4,6-dehydratase [Halobacteriovorax marinus]CBW25254.1 dTDP-glucose 4,6-dehydratase [Halobacteriovorax marinus SJ]
MKPTIILTGCAGFIGSNFVNSIAQINEIRKAYNFLIIDNLTYCGIYESIKESIDNNEHLSFKRIDIRNPSEVAELKKIKNPHGIIHFAAESHVDNSIKNPNIFIETNIIGTLNLLNLSLKLRETNSNFRFLHISTDEVYGSLRELENAFTENHQIKPSSPYSSSKAGSDLLVKSYFHTYSLNTVITRCSNNYGPFQFPEKLIPKTIINGLSGMPIPIYGNGMNIRDWIYVDDHNRGVWAAYTKGKSGETYNLGGECEKRNIEIAKNILKRINRSEDLIIYTEDRLGHDWRYAVDIKKSQEELSWKPKTSFPEGIDKTIEWYKENQKWVQLAQARII